MYIVKQLIRIFLSGEFLSGKVTGIQKSNRKLIDSYYRSQARRILDAVSYSITGARPFCFKFLSLLGKLLLNT